MFSTIENNKCDKCDKLPHPSLLIANNHERELVTGRNMMWNGIETSKWSGLGTTSMEIYPRAAYEHSGT